MKRIIPIFCALALMIYPAVWADVPAPTGMSKTDCRVCHSCDNPTAQNKCLKTCPGLPFSHGANTHQLREAPDSMLLDELADLYQPVHFNHKLHARMAEMNGHCATCHHYGSGERIQPCKDCHGGEANPNNLRQPGLKGAYHRQCLGCHREWSHDTQCYLCHIPTVGKALAAGDDKSDIMGISHPVIMEPVKEVYHTPYKAGPIVTFKHEEHLVLFGLRCVDCHKKENCSYCHDLQKSSRIAKTEEQIHGICNDCHRQDNCRKCHDNKERPAFSHESTGWALNRYHNKLDCRACHPTGKMIASLNNDCTNCHAGWSQENFEHVTTGLALDETHEAMECGDCHLNRKYNTAPDCSGCHDDGRNHRSMPPGKMMQNL